MDAFLCLLAFGMATVGVVGVVAGCRTRLWGPDGTGVEAEPPRPKPRKPRRR